MPVLIDWSWGLVAFCAILGGGALVVSLPRPKTPYKRIEKPHILGAGGGVRRA